MNTFHHINNNLRVLFYILKVFSLIQIYIINNTLFRKLTLCGGAVGFYMQNRITPFCGSVIAFLCI